MVEGVRYLFACFAFVIYVSHNNLLAAARKFSSPGLGCSRAREPCLCLHRICDHKLLNFLLLKIVKNVSTCRPRLGYFCTQKLCLCPHKFFQEQSSLLS